MRDGDMLRRAIFGFHAAASALAAHADLYPHDEMYGPAHRSILFDGARHFRHYRARFPWWGRRRSRMAYFTGITAQVSPRPRMTGLHAGWFSPPQAYDDSQISTTYIIEIFIIQLVALPRAKVLLPAHFMIRTLPDDASPHSIDIDTAIWHTSEPTYTTSSTCRNYYASLLRVSARTLWDGDFRDDFHDKLLRVRRWH